MSTVDIKNLRLQWRAWLKPSDNIETKPGYATGWQELDGYLATQGLPKGELTLLQGLPGSGRLSLWLQAAAKLTQEGKWVAWIQQSNQVLTSACLDKYKIRADRLLCIRAPEEARKNLWLLQETLSSQIFELIAFDFGDAFLSERQLRKMQNQARANQVGMVCISANQRQTHSSLFACILKIENYQAHLLRAPHRPTPKTFARRLSYDSFVGFHGYQLSPHALSGVETEFHLYPDTKALECAAG